MAIMQSVHAIDINAACASLWNSKTDGTGRWVSMKNPDLDPARAAGEFDYHL